MAKRAANPDAALDASTRICVLVGAEEMLKQEHLATLRTAMEAEHGQVEVFLYDGKIAPLADVLDELRSMSLMQSYKLVIVDDADVFVTAHRDAMERYAEGPVDNATLVFRASKWNKGNLDKLIEKVGAILSCAPLTHDAALQWMTRRASSEHKRKIEPAAAALLVERIGADLMLLDSELAKLSVAVADDKPIGVEAVRELVGRSSDEEAYAIQDALIEAMASGGDSSKVRHLLNELHEVVSVAGQPDVLVAYFVADVIRKLHIGTMLRKQGAGDSQISSALKLWGPRQQAFMQVLRKCDPKRTRALFDRIMRLDARSKSGFGEPLRNLEGFCAAIAQEMR